MGKKRNTKAHYHHSRRQFMNLMGMGSLAYFNADPLKLLISAISDGLIAKAQAAESGVLPRNYVVAVHTGAPPRWVFDSFLRPKGLAGGQFIRNTAVNNFITASTYDATTNVGVDYRDALIDLGGGRSIYLPILWGSTIPTISDGMVPMASILNNTMLLRGIDMEVDRGHGGSGQAMLTRVSDANPSLTGLVADASNRRIPAVGLNHAARMGGYQSVNGTSLAYLEPGPSAEVTDPIAKIIEPFSLTDPAVISMNTPRALMQSYIDQALSALGEYANSSKAGASALYQDRNNAEALFQQDLRSTIVEYNAALARYQQLARECAKGIPGIILENSGLPAWTSAAPTLTGAAGFAAAEVLLKHRLSSTVSFSMGGNWRVYNQTNFNDEHRDSPRMKSVLVHSHQFRCVAAWLNEFRNALGPTLFADTLVHVGSEYGRKGMHDHPAGGGSDHAPTAQSMTLFSGAIEKATFIGNIQIGETVGASLGTWGAMSPVVTSDGTLGVTKKNIGAGIADILRVRRPTSDKPIFTLESEKVVSLAEDPKNV